MGQAQYRTGNHRAPIRSASFWVGCGISSQFELAWKLLWDRRVSFFTKWCRLHLGYLLMPFDLVPDALLGLGQVDDLVVVLVG